MYISHFQLENIRCFRKAFLQLSPTINLLVGENNSGKSTLLQSVYTLQGGNIGPESIKFNALNANIAIGLSRASPEFFDERLRGFLKQHASSDVNVLFVYNADPQTMGNQVQIGENGTQFHPFPNTQPNNLVVPYLSDRRTSGFQESTGTQAAFSLNTLMYLPAKADNCYGSRELRGAYEEACKTVLGFVPTTWATGNGKMVGLEINAKRHQHIPIARLGSGVAQALGLIVELLVAENRIFIIEELENDLHPTALRSLLQLIERSSQSGNQFIISTHSNIVVRALGSIDGAKVFNTVRIASQDGIMAESAVHEVASDPVARRTLLQSLGYDLSDYDLYDAWLILEESSAERIIREFIIPWFAPKLAGRLRTIAAQGAGDVEVRFIDLHRLFVFIHLEPTYRNRAWVITDGDRAGIEAVEKLRDKFKAWPPDHFDRFPAEVFETFYPSNFTGKVDAIFKIEDRAERKRQKAALVEEVVSWLRADPTVGREALARSAVPVIEKLQAIEAVVGGAD